VRKIYDISMPIQIGMPVWKNKPEKQPALEITRDFSTHNVRETRLHLDAHTGTHIDAPLHMIEGGRSIDTIAMEQLIRPCRVIDLTHVSNSIGTKELEAAQPEPGDFLLLKTRNSFCDGYTPDFVFLNEDGAGFLAQAGVSGVGIDALGIERDQPGHPTHKKLFAAGIVIIEGLRLKDIEPGSYLLVAAPLKLVGIDAAPARVLLLSLKSTVTASQS
jgi:arylformamidase